MSGTNLLNDADANQARASDPSASAWVSANAGTGKTEVLVRRGLRLLLAGSRPEKILCLTYTKSAAAEMSNRLLKELANWATTSEEKLRARLLHLIGRAPDDAEMRSARRLFAQALEAKGGLKIYTIHGFCERLLQRFPLEAGVSPHFAVLDERSAVVLRRAAFDAVIARAAEERDGMLGKALAKIIGVAAEEQFRQVVDTVIAKREALQRMMALHDGLADWAAAECAALKQLFDIEQDCEEALVETVANVVGDGIIDDSVSALQSFGGTKDDDRVASALSAVKGTTGEARIAALRNLFCTAEGKPRKRMCSAGFKTDAPGVCAALDAAHVTFAETDRRLSLLRAAEASSALLFIADAVQGEYQRRKQAEVALDYEDLIVKAANLLSRAGAAAWVLYKIDGGMDHILVDEAQDTNPAQWGIIERLAEEFFAGEGASAQTRTLFAVGDEKQSIYSFQGADPARFAEVGRAFRQRAAALDLTWHEVPLNVSFRSTVPVLKAVDEVFAKPEAAKGLTWQENALIQHHASRAGEAGLVELWPAEAETKPQAAPPFEPWNNSSVGARAVDALCARIARRIKSWLTDKQDLESAGRPIRAGDVLILVRRREPFTAPMIRALKREGVSVAGADRMRLMEQLAVQDLTALADVLLMRDDDLSLAVVLKSPFFNFDDDDLFRVAYGRTSSLWSTLNGKMGEDPRFAEAADRLNKWAGRVDFIPPYEFFADVLGEKDQEMRKRLLTRLGPEAAEAIDEFLDLALAYDRDAAPSVQGFIDQLRAGDLEIKRDMEQERDEVRIMTVHGAKGLQAPIVFLPDTCMTPRVQGPRLYPLGRRDVPPDEIGHLVWAPGGADLQMLEEAKERQKQADLEEYNRLLYVAMTRAQDRLYVCGWQGQKEPDGLSWYRLVKDGLAGVLTEAEDEAGRAVLRLASPQEKPMGRTETSKERPAQPSLPDWARRPAMPEPSRLKLTPSGIGAGVEQGHAAYFMEQPPLGPRALAADSRYARGRLVHALLQHLPEVGAADQERAARAFVAARGSDLTSAILEEVVVETLAIVRKPDFAPLFAPGSLAEVPVVARIGEGAEGFDLEGQIDRLAILDDALLVLDYKTNRPPPTRQEDVSPAYIAQLAAYRVALTSLFPERVIRTALLWTDGPRLMEIDSSFLDAAERRIRRRGASLDAA